MGYDYDGALKAIRDAFDAGGYNEQQRIALIYIIGAAENGRALSLALEDTDATAHERERDMGPDGETTYRRGFHDGHVFLKIRCYDRMGLYLQNPIGQIEHRE